MNREAIQKKYLEHIKNINLNYSLIDNLKLASCDEFLELENLYKNYGTIGAIQEHHPTFKALICSEISRSYNQIIPLLRVARWIRKNKIALADLKDSPFPKIQLLAAADATDLSDLNLDYPIIKDKYERM